MRVDVHLTLHIPELKRIGAHLMASLTDLQTHVTELAGAVHNIHLGLTTVRTEIADLKAVIAAGGTVTQEELDALDANIQATQQEAAEIMTEEDAL